MKKILLFILLGLTVLGCRQKQVLLQQLQTAHYAHNNDLVRVYIDKRGSIYPSYKFFIPPSDFFIKKFKANKYGTLEEYYTKDSIQLQKVAVHYELETNSFSELQEGILKEKVDEIKKVWNDNKELIFLIHGFNDPNPSAEFYLLRQKIEKQFPDREFSFVEIYWDGLTANNGNPMFASIWGKAQVNSMYASLALRKIITQLPFEAKIRIITHSLGASVGTGALFNTYEKLPHPKGTNTYKDMMKQVCTPVQQDIRIGMIAPAIPGVNTFRTFKNRTLKTGRDCQEQAISPNQNNITRVVLGYKKEDYALKKWIFSKRLGATSLGNNAITKKMTEIERTKNELIAYPVIVKDFDFRDCNHKDEHGLYYYLQNTQALNAFLDALFK